MSDTTVKRAVTELIEGASNRGRLEMLDEFVAEEYQRRGPAIHLDGREAWKDWITAVRTALPDFHTEIKEILADSGRGAVRFTTTFTHAAPYLGFEPTGAKVTVDRVVMVRLQDGLLVDEWELIDQLGAFHQLQEASRAAVDGDSGLDAHQLFNEYAAAWRDHDVDRIMRLHPPDVVFRTYGIGNEVVGQSRVRDAFAQVFEQWPDWNVEVRRLYISGDLVVLEGTLSATLAVPLAVRDGTIQPNGRRIIVDAVDVLPIRDGLFSRKDTYIDHATALAQLSQPPDAGRRAT